MKIQTAFTFFFIAFLSTSCNQKNTPAQVNNTPAKDTTAFYPVNDYLRAQIKFVDSTPYFIYKITIRNGKKDSSHISLKHFDSLTSAFIAFNISDSAIKKITLKKYSMTNLPKATLLLIIPVIRLCLYKVLMCC